MLPMEPGIRPVPAPPLTRRGWRRMGLRRVGLRRVGQARPGESSDRRSG
jgi:hypothetical protein